MHSNVSHQRGTILGRKFCHAEMGSGRTIPQLGRTMPDVQPVISRPVQKTYILYTFYRHTEIWTEPRLLCFSI